LELINSIDLQGSVAGDPVYLETIFPVVVNDTMIIPPGAFVSGRVTTVSMKRNAKRRCTVLIRFEALILPNAVTRMLTNPGTRPTSDNRTNAPKQKGPKNPDLETISSAAKIGPSIGAVAGGTAGAGAGAAQFGAWSACNATNRTLKRGSVIDLVLIGPLQFDPAEVDFRGGPIHGTPIATDVPLHGSGAQGTSRKR
jgi:hypothetical protein